MATAKSQASTVGLLIPTLLPSDVEGWRNTGWSGVTQTTAELLSYWFEEERDGPQFHECQQRAIETIMFQTAKLPTFQRNRLRVQFPTSRFLNKSTFVRVQIFTKFGFFRIFGAAEGRIF